MPNLSPVTALGCDPRRRQHHPRPKPNTRRWTTCTFRRDNPMSLTINMSVPQITAGPNQAPILPTEEVLPAESCRLGRELGECPLRRAGCGSLHDAVLFVMPPLHIVEHVRQTMPDDKEVV